MRNHIINVKSFIMRKKN